MGFCWTGFRKYLFTEVFSPCGDPYPDHWTSRRFSRRLVRFVWDFLLSNLFLMLDFRDGQEKQKLGRAPLLASGPRETFAFSLSDKDIGGEACDVGPGLHRTRHFNAVASPFVSHVYLAKSSPAVSFHHVVLW